MDVGVVDIFETNGEGKRKKASCEMDFVVNKGVKIIVTKSGKKPWLDEAIETAEKYLTGS